MKAYIYGINLKKVEVEAKVITVNGIKCLLHAAYYFNTQNESESFFSPTEKTITDAYSGCKIASGESKDEAIFWAKRNMKSITDWYEWVNNFLSTNKLEPANPKLK